MNFVDYGETTKISYSVCETHHIAIVILRGHLSKEEVKVILRENNAYLGNVSLRRHGIPRTFIQVNLRRDERSENK